MCLERGEWGTYNLSVFNVLLVPRKQSYMLLVSCEEPDEQQYADGLNKQQMVMELDMATWEVSISYSESFTTVFRAITARCQGVQYKRAHNSAARSRADAHR